MYTDRSEYAGCFPGTNSPMLKSEMKVSSESRSSVVHAHYSPHPRMWKPHYHHCERIEMDFVHWFLDRNARLANCRWPSLLASAPSRNGLMPLTGVRPRDWHVRGRAKYFYSCSPAARLLQYTHVRRTLPPNTCSSLLVSSKYSLKHLVNFIILLMLYFIFIVSLHWQRWQCN